MKTAKEKAIEILSKINGQNLTVDMWQKASDYAKKDLKRKGNIAVDETIKALNLLLNSGLNNDFDILKLRSEYMGVKSEIEKL